MENELGGPTVFDAAGMAGEWFSNDDPGHGGESSNVESGPALDPGRAPNMNNEGTRRSRGADK